MFKIFDEVMDKDGRQYTVVGYKDLLYEIMFESNLASVTRVGEYELAKYDPLIASSFVKIAEQIARVGVTLNEIKNMQTNLFEKVRQQT